MTRTKRKTDQKPIVFIPTIDDIFGSCKRRTAVVILAGPSLHDFVPQLSKVVASGPDVLVCNNWKVVREKTVPFDPTWIFMLDHVWCRHLLRKQVQEFPDLKFVTMLRLDASLFGDVEIYSETYGEWKGFPKWDKEALNRRVASHKKGMFTEKWDRVTLWNSGDRMIQMAWYLGYEEIHIFGWSCGVRDRYSRRRVYDEEKFVTNETFISQRRRATVRNVRLLKSLGEDKHERLRIYERKDHPHYEDAKECFVT